MSCHAYQMETPGYCGVTRTPAEQIVSARTVLRSFAESWPPAVLHHNKSSQSSFGGGRDRPFNQLLSCITDIGVTLQLVFTLSFRRVFFWAVIWDYRTFIARFRLASLWGDQINCCTIMCVSHTTDIFSILCRPKGTKKMKRMRTFPFRLLTLMFQFVFGMFLKLSGCQDITLLDIYREKKDGKKITASPPRSVSHVLIHFINFCHTFA